MEAMRMLLIANGTIINPKTDQMEQLDILINEDRIIEIGTGLAEKVNTSERFTKSEIEVIDAKGYFVTPGFIDLHVHLREPGFEHKETIFTGSRACAKGGYTSVVCMPNTKPALDSVETIEKLKKIIERDSVISIYPAGAITLGIAGEVMSNHEQLIKSGAVALSDDGRTTMNEDYMREVFKVAKAFDKPVMTHSEDHEITVHYKNSIFPTEAESNIVVRDIALCREVDGILHVSHVSTKAAIDAIEKGKVSNPRLTCEAAPHHFALSVERVDMTSNYSKVSPPIRSESDRKYLVEAIKKGIIDVIATDHAPHEKESKECAYSEASYGISGIESAFSVSHQSLVNSGEIPLKQLIRMLTINPANIARLKDVGSIEKGYYADLTLLDLEASVTIDSKTFISKGKNTPFNGYIGKGEVIMTIHHGKEVYRK
jgi:dihydroorotase